MSKRVKPVRWRRGIIALALLTPLFTAAIAIGAVGNPSTTNSSGQPNLQGAIVNEDQYVMLPVNGEQVPFTAGRILVGDMVTSTDSGFSWDITDAATAQAGLDSGAFSAIVTIPKNFTQAYLSSAGANPEQAQLDIETDGSHSYLAAVLSRALASNVQASLSQTLTQTYVSGLLDGFSALGQGLTAASQGSAQLTSGLSAISNVTSVLPGATQDLADGSKLVSQGMSGLTSALSDLATYGGQSVEKSVEVAAQLDTLLTLANTLPDGATKTELIAQINALIADADSLVGSTAATDLGIGLGAIAADIIGQGSALVGEGNQALADGMPLLNEGVDLATQGSAALTQGLGDIGTALPNYTPDQAANLGKIITTPIETNLKTNPELPRASGAVAAFAVPISLWLGALVLALVYLPFERRALTTQASTARIVWGAVLPTLAMALIQATLVMLGAMLAGIEPVHNTGFFVLALVSSASFVLLHQGFAALSGRFAWLVSIAFLALQIIAAGVILPSAFLPTWVQGLGEILPLSQSIMGSQELITSNTLTLTGASFGWLIAWALIGCALIAVGVARGRMLKPRQVQPTLSR